MRGAIRHRRTRNGTALSYVDARSDTTPSYGTAARYDGTALSYGTAARYDGTALSYLDRYGTVVRGRGERYGNDDVTVVRGRGERYGIDDVTCRTWTPGVVRQRARRDRTHATQHVAPHALGALAKGTSNPQIA
ncbi:hypothetical protein Vretimale_5757, partial [Volvox reticuliferus]